MGVKLCMFEWKNSQTEKWIGPGYSNVNITRCVLILTASIHVSSWLENGGGHSHIHIFATATVFKILTANIPLFDD